MADNLTWDQWRFLMRSALGSTRHMVINVTYDGVTKPLDIDTMKVSEARECEEKTGQNYVKWRERLEENDPEATLFAWWLANRRAGTPLEGPYHELDIDLFALSAELDLSDGEMEQIAAYVSKLREESQEGSSAVDPPRTSSTPATKPRRRSGSRSSSTSRGSGTTSPST